MSRMSDNLLKLTSLESNHHPFEAKNYRLDRQLRHIILSCEPLWQGKNIEMDVDLPDVSIDADEDLMSQVWINLIHNSIKFTPEGGTIRVNLTKKDGTVQVAIVDSGSGISVGALPIYSNGFIRRTRLASVPAEEAVLDYPSSRRSSICTAAKYSRAITRNRARRSLLRCLLINVIK